LGEHTCVDAKYTRCIFRFHVWRLVMETRKKRSSLDILGWDYHVEKWNFITVSLRCWNIYLKGLLRGFK
jgi:hypothetical protein